MKNPDWLVVWRRKLFFHLAYRRKPCWDSGVTPPEATAFVAAHPPGRALDLGCGSGTNVIYLAQHGWEAWGVDFVGQAVRQGRRKARNAGVSVHLLRGDISRSLGVAGFFDLVLDIGCRHGVPLKQRAGYDSNLQRLLADGGYYLLYGFMFDPSNPGRPGLDEADLEGLGEWLHLENRVEGVDPNGLRSVWLIYSR